MGLCLSVEMAAAPCPHFPAPGSHTLCLVVSGREFRPCLPGLALLLSPRDLLDSSFHSLDSMSPSD